MSKWLRCYPKKYGEVYRGSKFRMIYGEWIENIKRRQDEYCNYRIQLSKNDDHLEILPETWFQSLNIAKENGWIPKGTLPPKCDCGYFCICRELWHGRYDTCEDQYVSEEDALGYAEALQQAVLFKSSPAIEVDWIWLVGCPARPKRDGHTSLSNEIEQVIRHKQKTMLVQLINFCRRGGKILIGETEYTGLLDW